MTKRQNTSVQGPVPNTKRPRKAAGFRLARPPAASASQPTASTSSSLFVTVSQNEGRPGILNVRSRVITSVSETPKPMAQSNACSTSLFDTQEPHNIPAEFVREEGDDTQQPQATKKQKRKRQTTNYVCPSPQCTEFNMI